MSEHEESHPHNRSASVFDSILLEATEALLAQQAEIKRLHCIIRWCTTRLENAKATELEALLRGAASKPTHIASQIPRG